MKVVAFNGSPRKTGNTSILISAVLDELEKEGIETEFVQIGGQPLRGCVACMKCLKEKNKRCANDDDNMNEYIEKMIAADGILLGSPTYFATVSTEIKALIDRAGYVARVNGSLFKRKVGAGVVAMRRAGSVNVFDTMNHLFTISEMVVPSSSYWNMGVGLKPGDVKDDKEGMETMRILGENMAWLLKKIHQ
ncbi:MAG: flavodoxin family protein [Thermodesulfobacteriota bacterium]